MADPKIVAEKPGAEPPKTPVAKAKDLRDKGFKPKKVEADLNETILKRLRASAPRNKDAGTYEVAMTDKEILSRIKFTLDLGVDPFDDLIGGLPFGRLCEVFGLESCLAGDSFIQFSIRDAAGKVQNSKGGTLKRLWHRFHGVLLPGQGNYPREQTASSEFYVPSINAEDGIFHNQVIDVVKTGLREVFEIKTVEGRCIRATADHKFYTGAGYVLVSNLKAGSTVYIHNNTPYTGRTKVQTYRQASVKYYYMGAPKETNGSWYYPVYIHRLVYEAQINQLSLEEYKALLNSGIEKLPDSFWTVPEGCEVHHRDHDRWNNDPGNLEMYTQAVHHQFHALEYHNKLRFIAVPDTVLSVEPAGLMETYDVKCCAPHNNYVANGFVVHNCGKSQLVIRAAGRAALKHIRAIDHDRIGKRVDPKKVYVHVLYVDNEQSIDKDEKIVIDGIPIKVHLARCDTVEHLFKMADISIMSVKEAQVKDKNTIYFILIVTDTIAAVASREEMTQEWGKVDYSRQPKSIREGFRILQRDLSRVNVCWVCTNQVGDNMKAASGGMAGGRRIRYSTPQADDFNSPGGRALKFYATHRIFMFKVRDFKLYPKTKFPSGMVVGFRSEKNRVLKPKREGRLVLLYGDEDGKGGGFDNLFSKLETMVFLGGVKRGESGIGLSFRFEAFGIAPKTFAPEEIEKSLDETDDDQGTENEDAGKDPRIRYTGDFPKFYENHKADIDLLYRACIKSAFATEVPPDDDEDEGGDILGEEET